MRMVEGPKPDEGHLTDAELDEIIRKGTEAARRDADKIPTMADVGDSDADEDEEETSNPDTGETVKYSNRRYRTAAGPGNNVKVRLSTDQKRAQIQVRVKDRGGDWSYKWEDLTTGYRVYNNPSNPYYEKGDKKQFAGAWYWDDTEKNFVRTDPTGEGAGIDAIESARRAARKFASNALFPTKAAFDEMQQKINASDEEGLETLKNEMRELPRRKSGQPQWSETIGGGGDTGGDAAAAAAAEEARIRALEQQVEEERRRVEAAAAAAAAAAAGGALAGGRPGLDPRLATLAANRTWADRILPKPRWYEYINPFAWPKMYARRKAREYAYQSQDALERNTPDWIRRRLPTIFGPTTRPGTGPTTFPPDFRPRTVDDLRAMSRAARNMPTEKEIDKAYARALREQGAERWDDAKMAGHTEILARMAAKWRKMPRWMTLGASAVLLAGGIASATVVPAMAGFTAAAALAWRTASAGATGITVGAMAQKYFEKRNSKRPALLGALTGFATGALVFAAPRAFADYIGTNFGGGVTPDVPSTEGSKVTPGTETSTEKIESTRRGSDIATSRDDPQVTAEGGKNKVPVYPLTPDVPEITMPDPETGEKAPKEVVVPDEPTTNTEGKVKIAPIPEPTGGETTGKDEVPGTEKPEIDIPPGFKAEPVISGKESVWSLGAKGLEQLDLLDSKDAQRFMHVHQLITDRMGLKGDLLGAENAKVAWERVDDNVPVLFGNLYNMPEFEAAMKKEIATNYKTLARGMGDLDVFFENLKYAYPRST